ncbi:MAG TPA: hypothetical protein VGC21_06900 [Telluria sp.]|jgi:hypothetical protein
MKNRALQRAQRGQALTEFIVVALALIPLFLLMPIIAKYQDMVHATEMASRYVAFEATNRNDQMGTAGYKTREELTTEVQRRFFSNPDAPIKTGDAPGDFRGHQNMFWRDQHGDALIKKFSDISITFGESQGADHGSAYSAASDGMPFNTVPLNVREELGLQARGIYTANVTVKVANLDSAAGSWTRAYDEFRNINLSITRSTSLSIDSWTASGPLQVESRIDKTLLFPGRLLRPLQTPVGLAVSMSELPRCFPVPCSPDIGPRMGDLDFWRDQVPADRLR